jgi:hypothetical protein
MGIEITPEVESQIKKKYEEYCHSKFKSGAMGTMTYQQFREWIIKRRVALF